MRHLVSGRKLKRTSSHRKALLANLATELFRHKSIKTTEAKAKELRPYAEGMITKAKNALLREKQNALSEGQTIDVHTRRIVAKHIRVKEVLSELFDSIAPAVLERNGGYTRVVKTGVRQGDSARTAIIELVDFAAEQDGKNSIKKKPKKGSNLAKKDKSSVSAQGKVKPADTQPASVAAEPVVAAPVVEEVHAEEIAAVDLQEEPIAADINENAGSIEEIAAPEEVNDEVEKPSEDKE